jgi:hypothetical protein
VPRQIDVQSRRRAPAPAQHSRSLTAETDGFVARAGRVPHVKAAAEPGPLARPRRGRDREGGRPRSSSTLAGSGRTPRPAVRSRTSATRRLWRRTRAAQRRPDRAVRHLHSRSASRAALAAETRPVRRTRGTAAHPSSPTSADRSASYASATCSTVTTSCRSSKRRCSTSSRSSSSVGTTGAWRGAYVPALADNDIRAQRAPRPDPPAEWRRERDAEQWLRRDGDRRQRPPACLYWSTTAWGIRPRVGTLTLLASAHSRSRAMS